MTEMMPLHLDPQTKGGKLLPMMRIMIPAKSRLLRNLQVSVQRRYTIAEWVEQVIGGAEGEAERYAQVEYHYGPFWNWVDVVCEQLSGSDDIINVDIQFILEIDEFIMNISGEIEVSLIGSKQDNQSVKFFTSNFYFVDSVIDFVFDQNIVL